MPTSVIGKTLEACCYSPRTGFFRDGYCRTGADDTGLHTVCAVMTSDFLTFTRSQGNDLSTPRPEFDFPGLKEGDHWCLCVGRWAEACREGQAPPVILEATHVSALEYVNLEDLRSHEFQGL